MLGLFPNPLYLTKTKRSELEKLVKRHSTPQQIVLRARIIMLADEGKNHRQIARELKISRDTARHWRRRWFDMAGDEKSVPKRLQDATRSGLPPTFTAEQLTHLFAIACEDPRESGRPISHRRSRELADELIKRNIVESISPRHVGRLPDEPDLKPHQRDNRL
ncbi:MAG: helix-turn-helix domain-containing protein [Methanosarcinales archaeon]